MLLAINIGNTNIHLGVFKGNVMLRKYTFPLKTRGISAQLEKMAARYAIDCAIVCSVVPGATARLEATLKKTLKKNPYIVGRTIVVPLVNLYRKPRQLGQDRLLNAYAAAKLYGAPAIVVDLGTAVTFDMVSKKGYYAGGMIVPGLGICLEALTRNTALLPKIKLAKPREFIGKDTVQSMLSGLVYGFAAMADGLIRKIKEEIKSDACVIATGGDSRFLASYCTQLKIIDQDLTLKGINILYNILHR